ncbi:MAG: hypothetical protein Q8M66_01645 [Actinomycetota bacterium]|nr:hypothetical protein [Actinomycetota bacterium]MDZ4179065.1 hypothetical protein [Coriobacteriia bacterium]
MSELRIRFIGPVDERLRPEVCAFARWIREWYTFTNPLEIRLCGDMTVSDWDGEPCSLVWRQSDRGREKVTAELAVGTFAQNLEVDGDDVAYPTVLYAIGRIIKYYFQSIHGAQMREDYADRWSEKLFAAYCDDTTPPPPRSGIRLQWRE